MAPHEPQSNDQDFKRRLAEAIHDINNLLLIIACSSTDAMDRFSENEPLCDILLAIREAGSRIAEVTSGLQEHLGPRPDGASSSRTDTSVQNQRGGETILVVDDDSQVRTFLKSALVLQGYQVLEARHGPAAIALALRQPGTIDFLITDMLMPEMDGHELAEAMRLEYPSLRVLYLSGLHDDSATMSGGQYLDTFVQKPFKMPELLVKIREILDNRIELK